MTRQRNTARLILRPPRSEDLASLFAIVRPSHAASIKVLEKVGMQRMGSLDDVPGQAPSWVYRANHG
jgi:hypothetical protein